MTFDTWFQSRNPDIPGAGASAVLRLVDEGATVPFIARYRKERTQNLDEVKVQRVIDERESWDDIVKRQALILEQAERHKKLTPELEERVRSTFDPDALEDLYLPFRRKRKSKAAQAREAGIEPLAEWIWRCGHGTETPLPGQTLELWAFTFRNEEAGYPETVSVIQGAQDILTERLAEDPELRQLVRTAYFQKGSLRTRKGEKATVNSRFEKYFDHIEPVSDLMPPESSHRYLAIRRGLSEGELAVDVVGPKDDPAFETRLLEAFERAACSVPDSPGAEVLRKAARTALKGHVVSSIEGEIHRALKTVADRVAIQVFSENVRQVLLASPFGSKRVLGVDPGIRSGAKLALVDEAGGFVRSSVIHSQTEEQKAAAKTVLLDFLSGPAVQAIAVGNGTGGRESEQFIRATAKEAGLELPVVMVSEAGASVYSASEVAREEFPHLDLTVRGAISIARRLQDPLAELVKVDPKSIGVGQYQHDVPGPSLKQSLTQVVDSCVNLVGVDLNTASKHLLQHVSGIGPAFAKAIVERRESRGLFRSRRELLDLPQFGAKAFEQSAGFLRVRDGENPLDNTGVHPEHYAALEALASRLGKGVGDLVGQGVDLVRAAEDLREAVGSFTFADIVKELEKPGRDPRDVFVPFQFREDVHTISDLKAGMVCPGIVTNVTNFGAFVDVGVRQDGLVHISHISDRFVKDPRIVAKPGDRVQVRVLAVNLDKSQISLSMKSISARPPARAARKVGPAGTKAKPAGPPAKPAPPRRPEAPLRPAVADVKPPPVKPRTIQPKPRAGAATPPRDERRDRAPERRSDLPKRPSSSVSINTPFASLAQLTGLKPSRR
jgi:protein Tex